MKHKSSFRCSAAFRPGFTLLEIMIVILVIGILLAIAVPNFINARESSRAKACVANLYQINSGKLQCMMDNSLANTSTVTFSIDGLTPTTIGPNGVYQLTRISGTQNYLRSIPACPLSGTYNPGSVNVAPTCSIATDPSSSANYQAGGKWFHGY